MKKFNGFLKNELSMMRRFRGKSQVELAVLSGCSQTTISAIENGTWYPSLYLAMSICKALECDISDIFYFE